MCALIKNKFRSSGNECQYKPNDDFLSFKHIPNIEDCHVFKLCCVFTWHVVSVRLSIKDASPRKENSEILNMDLVLALGQGCLFSTQRLRKGSSQVEIEFLTM